MLKFFASFMHDFLSAVSSNRGARLLLFANLCALILSLVSGSGFKLLLWLYYFQVISIGTANIFKILAYLNPPLDKSTYGWESLTPKLNRFNIIIAFFFIFHFGIFNLGFYLLLSQILGPSTLYSSIIVFIGSLIFLLVHMHSFITNWPLERNYTKLRSLMLGPYFRIIPMILIILAGLVAPEGMSSQLFIFFIILKIIFDVFLHAFMHNIHLDVLKKVKR